VDRGKQLGPEDEGEQVAAEQGEAFETLEAEAVGGPA
jgi:hypothetical protein